MFATYMEEASRLASDMCMARSRPSSTLAKGTSSSKRRAKMGMPGRKLELAARPSLAHFSGKRSAEATLSSAAEALRWFALPLDLKSTRIMPNGSRAKPTRPIIIPKVYGRGAKRVDEDDNELSEDDVN
ncbi:unnamed protein product [Sphacelaria rigidula]